MEGVGAETADADVVAGVPVQSVVARAAHEAVVAARADEVVVAGRAEDEGVGPAGAATDANLGEVQRLALLRLEGFRVDGAASGRDPSAGDHGGFHQRSIRSPSASIRITWPGGTENTSRRSVRGECT